MYLGKVSDISRKIKIDELLKKKRQKQRYIVDHLVS